MEKMTHRFRNFLCYYLAIGEILVFMGMVPANAQSASNEYQVKTAFLYNLVRMVEWPDEPISTPIIMCFYGEDFFGDALDSIKNKMVRDRSLIFKKNVELGDIKRCHVLFISRSEKDNLTNILLLVDRLPILTVGDINQFAYQGGIINFMTEDKKIRIEVNLRVAKNAALKISSRLLSLAHIVEE